MTTFENMLWTYLNTFNVIASENMYWADGAGSAPNVPVILLRTQASTALSYAHGYPNNTVVGRQVATVRMWAWGGAVTNLQNLLTLLDAATPPVGLSYHGKDSLNNLTALVDDSLQTLFSVDTTWMWHHSVSYTAPPNFTAVDVSVEGEDPEQIGPHTFEVPDAD